MKRDINLIKKLVICTILTLCFSCKNKPTLQRYIVDHAKQPEFISGDVSKSVLQIDETTLNETTLDAFKSLSGLNYLVCKQKESAPETYKKNKNELKRIIKQEQFHDLMELHDKTFGKLEIKYLGNEVNIEELIVFIEKENFGFLVLRLIGNDMNPDKIMTLIREVSSTNLERFKSSIKNIIDFLN